MPSGERHVSRVSRVSILPIVSKIIEKIIFSQIYKYLEGNNIISDHQSGFRPLNSTLTALLKVTIVWLKNMDEGKIKVAVFLDLKKAFDTVDHDILIKTRNFKQFIIGRLVFDHCFSVLF